MNAQRLISMILRLVLRRAASARGPGKTGTAAQGDLARSARRAQKALRAGRRIGKF